MGCKFRRQIGHVLAALVMCSAAGFGGDCGCRGNAAPRIIDGEARPTTEWPTVGTVGDSKTGFYCTGTLIAPHFVLSAAHCVVDRVGKLAFAQNEGRFMLNGVVYHSTHVYVHPAYLGDASQEMEGAIDVSLFELDRDVPDVTPSQLMRQQPVPGMWMTLVGYGELGTGKGGVNGTFPPPGTITVGRTQLDILTDTFTKWRFESKPAPGESNTAPGDSGGPQFMVTDGVMAIASITSGGRKTDAGFGDLSYNTRIDVAAPWIDSIVGGTTVAGNTAPVIQSLMVSADNPKAGETVTFTCAASDADSDALQYHWMYGDGLETIDGTAAQPHTYPLDGMFQVTVIVTDGRGGSVQTQTMLKVGGGVTLIPVVPSAISKQKFALSFTSPTRDSLQFTLTNTGLMFPSRNEFFNTLNGSVIRIYIDQTPIDALTVVSGRPIGSGTMNFNYKSGMVTYQVRSNAALAALLQPFGAVNATVNSTITVPLRMQVRNVRYGGDATFNYTGIENKSGVGK